MSAQESRFFESLLGKRSVATSLRSGSRYLSSLIGGKKDFLLKAFKKGLFGKARSESGLVEPTRSASKKKRAQRGCYDQDGHSSKEGRRREDP